MEELQVVRAVMHGLRSPGIHDKVYKEECVFSFENPESPGGLYINLRTFQVLLY
jgi:ubiquitin carboxyl-terminal hydrolase 5/13